MNIKFTEIAPTAYVLGDYSLKNWFKVGYTIRTAHLRRKEEDGRINAKRFHCLGKTYVYREWNFNEEESAFYIEQRLLKLIQKLGGKKVDKCDWYEIEKAMLDSAIAETLPLIESLHAQGV
jgi:protein tyrosine/serine phosphatase